MNDSPRNARILIVDDTLQNIQVLGTILKGKNYQINVARNGSLNDYPIDTGIRYERL